ncbi:tetratricopeptide repeat-containing hybrid sensor histidine kinase/response regulator [Croceivirga radicis]|uniref:tetratricopeptide repeat-containing hybrid sensor histidine kinase/response regulator n=1 Tax=Croceivirga radicis TaxID=1929488 RepID=UPI000255B040|nr:response regulator [Croceivirga radicis]
MIKAIDPIKKLTTFLLIGLFLLQGISLQALTLQVSNDPFKEARNFIHHDNKEEALKALQELANSAEQEDNMQLLLDTYHQFSLLYLELEDLETTLFYWDRAGVLLKTTEYPYGDAVHKYINAVLLYRSDNNFQAMRELNEVKRLTNDKNLLNRILLAEADIYLKLDKFEDAKTNYNALLVNSDNLERSFLATKANLGLARLHKKLEDLESAQKHGEAAMEIALKNQYFREIDRASRFLAKTYEELGDYASALKFNKKILNLRDSIYNLNRLEAQNKKANQIKFDQFAKTLEDLEGKNEELSASANRSEITAILTSAFLTIISILAVSLYRNNQIKLKTNDLLQTKNSELEIARDAAVTAMEAKMNFLSTVTHELRTPLYAVTGLTHLLLEENPAEHQKEHLKSLKFSGDYLLNFINDILQINKIDAEKLEPLNIDFKLTKVINDVIDSLQQNAKDSKTSLVVNIDKNIPPTLLGDPLKLSQIFMNLVGNALKFTKNGTVTVTAKLKEHTADQVTIYFAVSDTGIGISEEQQKNIFDSFEQGSIQINREYGGTGLGLTIVKSLLGLFDSKINLNSAVGEGSTFFFDLNFKVKETYEEELTFEPSVDDYNFEGLHVLVVEDNKINQVITKKMLNKKGITCDIANNGNEAIDAAKANEYAVILMDIHMPGISGTEATKQIRKFNTQIPIIALTAISMEDSLDEFFEAGCNAVVTKPFKPEVFYTKIGENVFGSQTTSNS